MADFHQTIILSKLPGVFSERRFVDGKEQPCLIIPVESANLFQTKWGEYFMKTIIRELPQPDASGETHRVALLYRNRAEIQKAERIGYRKTTERIGKCIPWNYDSSRKYNYSNDKATDIFVRGAICLDDINQSKDITVSPHTGQRYVKCQFKSINNQGTPIYCIGAICFSDIIESDIITNPRTGKRNVMVVFRKLKEMDRQFNTHELLIQRPDGGMITIGLFREYKDATETQKRIAAVETQLNPQPQGSTQPQQQPSAPLKIDGYNF
jgi:hypothetical protein